MTIQEASDKLTELCHQGHAQAELQFISGYEVKEINCIEMIGPDAVLLSCKEAEEKTK